MLFSFVTFETINIISSSNFLIKANVLFLSLVITLSKSPKDKDLFSFLIFMSFL
ncbi:MAG TPA: hypothetical protein PK771_16245 [Spirochaetota bacterium]|nr:hypothetical protein [Spirochaetota bacterium]